MARKKYNYNFVRKPSEGGKEALYMAGASVFLFLLASIVSFAFRGNGGIFLGAAGLFSFLLSGYGFYVGMKSFKEEQVSQNVGSRLDYERRHAGRMAGTVSDRCEINVLS